MNLQAAVDEFLHYTQIEKNCSEHTYRAYAFDLHVFTDFVRKIYDCEDLTVLTHSTARRFVQDQMIVHRCRTRTMQRRISCLKSFCKFCLKERWIESDFMAGIPAPRTDRKLPKYMRWSDVKQLFEYLEHQDHPLALRNETVFKLLATTGLRRQEVVDLKWRQINLEESTLLVFGKGKKERLLPLRSMIVGLLRRYKESLESH